MTRHLSTSILRALLERQPGPGAHAGAHLLTCARCQAKLVALAPRRARGFLNSLKDLAPTARLLQTQGPELILEAEREFRAACLLAQRLPALTKQQRRKLVLHQEELPPISLGAGILSVLPGLIHDSPEAVIDLCEIGLALISPEGFDVASCSTASVLAEFEANLANALRVLAQLPDAERHIDRALLLAEETPDDHVRGTVLLYASLIARDMRNFELASKLARKSKATFKRIGDLVKTNRVRRIEASVDFFRGEFTLAIARINALLLEKDLERVVQFSATFMLVKALVLNGSAFRAATLFHSLNELAAAFPGEHLAVQFSWLKGLILGSTRDPDAGEALMDRARRYYLGKENLYDAALVTLDMAMVRFEAGQYDQAANHAESIIEAFAVSGIHREALAALRYFQEAVKAKDEARARYKELQVYLPLSRRDPTYSYRPGAIG